MRDLTKDVQAVFTATTLYEKKHAVLNMIENSHAKATTKKLLTQKASFLNSMSKLDKFAADYMMSGEGLKVN